jgi:hypothetical protein
VRRLVEEEYNRANRDLLREHLPSGCVVHDPTVLSATDRAWPITVLKRCMPASPTIERPSRA